MTQPLRKSVHLGFCPLLRRMQPKENWPSEKQQKHRRSSLGRNIGISAPLPDQHWNNNESWDGNIILKIVSKWSTDPSVKTTAGALSISGKSCVTLSIASAFGTLLVAKLSISLPKSRMARAPIYGSSVDSKMKAVERPLAALSSTILLMSPFCDGLSVRLLWVNFISRNLYQILREGF